MMYTKTASNPLMFAVFLLLPFTATTASFDPVYYQQGTSASSLINFQTNNANIGTQTFILFGDGFFATGEGNSIIRSHRYAATNTAFTSTAYFLEKYKSDPPTSRTINVTTGSGQSDYMNPDVDMSACCKIGTSWSPSPGGEFFDILSFSNNCSTKPVSGSFKYYFDSETQNFSIADLLIYNNWIVNPEIVASDDPNYSSMLLASYSDLAYNEVRHIYIYVKTVSSAVGDNIDSKLTITGLECGGTTAYASIASTKYPHDPNDKTVDQESVCVLNLNAHELLYTVNFHNDGEDFAKTIIVYDKLEERLIPSSAQLISSTANCIMESDGNLKTFIFKPIMLPGSNQTSPHIYPYNDCTGSFSFSVKTMECLPFSENPITNEASIVFDNQSPMLTGLAKTYFKHTECVMNCGEYARTALQNHDKESLEISPNPAQTAFNLTFKPEKPWNIHIFDAQGRQIFSQSGENAMEFQQITVQAGDWTKGLYFVRLQDGNKIQSSKLIKI